METAKLPVKKCNTCGAEHPTVPANAREWVDENVFMGWFWECKCGSTMFKKASK